MITERKESRVERLSIGLYKLTLVGVTLPAKFPPYTYKVGEDYVWIDSLVDLENIIHECFSKCLIVKDLAMSLLGQLNDHFKSVVTITYYKGVCTIDSPYCLVDWLENWFDVLGTKGSPRAFSKRLNKNLYKFEVSYSEYTELLLKLKLEGVEYRNPLPVKIN